MISKMIFSLAAALICAMPAMAGDTAHPMQCTSGTSNCPPAVHSHPHDAARQAREAACAQDPQSCDERGKSLRSEASDEVRDRHACRD